jgi:hypothetical protein
VRRVLERCFSIWIYAGGAFEAFGVFAGGDAEDAEEGAAHGVCGVKAAGVGDLFQAHGGAVDHLLGSFDAHAVYDLSGVHLGFAEADSGEVARADAHAFGEAVDGEVFAKMFEHPDLQLAKGLRGDGLAGEHVAVLRLSAGTYKEHDELAGDGERGFVAVVLFDEGKGEVDAGGDAGRGVDGAIAEEDGVGLDLDGGEVAGEAVAEVPVSDCMTAIEEARGGEGEGSGADGGDAAGAGCGFGDPGEEVGVIGAAFGSGASGDEEGVDAAGELGEGDGVGEGEAAISAQEVAAVGGADDDLIVRCGGEDLERADDIEDLHRWRTGDDDLSHAHSVRHWVRGVSEIA